MEGKKTSCKTRLYGLDKLINDEDIYVRAEVARQGFGLDKLINDKSWVVRAAVASQYYLTTVAYY